MSEEEEEDFVFSSPGDEVDNESDVDWEEVGNVSSESEEQKETAVPDVDWAQVSRDLAKEDAKAPKTKKRKRPLNKVEKARQLSLHKTHLLLLISSVQQGVRSSQSVLLQGLLVSLTASSRYDLKRQIDRSTSESLVNFVLPCILRWFQQHIVPIDSDTTGQEEWTEAALTQALSDRRATSRQIILLFFILCRGLSLTCRLVSALDPFLIKDSKAFEKASERHEEWMWLEVWDWHASSWISVDPFRQLIHRPLEMEERRGPGLIFSYVLAVEANGALADVSARYTSSWSKSLLLRIADDWFRSTLSQFNARLPLDEETEERLAREERQLTSRKAGDAMPSSAAGFRKHQVYCLEKHLGKYETIYPRKAVGVFEGAPVFLRSHIQTLRTSFQWRRLGKNVRKEEKEKPTRRESGRQSVGQKALYGEWQTELVEVPSVVDGRVPKNSYGNIEVWSEAHIPSGGTHVRLRHAAKLAAELGIDYAPAVVGFEVKGGRNVPTIEGVIVPTDAVGVLEEACEAEEQRSIEIAIRKQELKVVKRWEKLAKRLLLQKRLEDEYGKV